MTDGAAHPTDRFCQGLRCGQSVFVGGRPPSGHERTLAQPPGLVEQNARALSSVANILDQLLTSADDIVKFNTWRAPPPTVQAYTDADQDRFSFLCGAAPAVTGITVPNLQATGDLIRMDASAMLPAAAERFRLMPMDHWDWKLKTSYSHGVRCSDLLFVGGQAALDEHSDVVRLDMTAAQTHIAMIYIGRILREGGATFDDVIKLNAYYRGTDSVAGLTENLKVRNSYFAAPGPIATAVPVDNLAYPRMQIEIEVVARCRAGQDI
jgi:enamine deaminase RidA (YjgF/YER057c/UK114 family)